MTDRPDAYPVPWWHLHRRLYDWTLSWAHRPSSSIALFALSFAESSFFPIPPDVLLIALVMGNTRKWLRLAMICTIASVLGALAGYGIGHELWQILNPWFFKYVPGFTPEAFAKVGQLYETHNFWIVFVAGFTPIPYKLITITGGAFGISLAPFIVASIVSRGARFFLVAGLVRLFGPKVKPFIERHFNWLTLAFVVLAAGGIAAVKYLR
jgi:membrane protein YqaA with SNARE-associated domain